MSADPCDRSPGGGVAFLAGLGAATCAVTILLGPRAASSHVPITTSVVFKREVVQIFQRKCFQCHTEHNLAMPLTTYREARPWARAIREEILERRMPPWRAVSGHGRFANDVSLTSREIDLLVAWVDGGVPSGMPKADEGRPPVEVTTPDGWDHGDGEPDIVREFQNPRAVEPGTGDQVVRVLLPPGLSRARWLRGVAFRPGERRVVRGAAIYTADTRRWLGAWTPSHGATRLPEGVAYRLAAGTRLAVDVYYRAAETAVTDRSAVGLYLADRRPARIASNVLIAADAVAIPARTSHHRVRQSAVLRGEMSLVAVWPELGPGGRSLEMTARTPSGVVQPLLWIHDFSHEWPTPYVFQTPVALPRGTTILVTAYFENAGDRPSASRLRATVAVARPAA